VSKSPIHSRGDRQIMDHIVNSCPLTKFEDFLAILHEAEDDAVNWLDSMATTALAKQQIVQRKRRN